MAIHIAGVPFTDMRNTVYEARNAHDRNLEARMNLSDTMLFNIQAGTYSSHTMIDIFPNTAALEREICGW